MSINIVSLPTEALSQILQHLSPSCVTVCKTFCHLLYPAAQKILRKYMQSLST